MTEYFKKCIVSRKTTVMILSFMYMFITELSRLCFSEVMTHVYTTASAYDRTALCAPDPASDDIFPEIGYIIKNHLHLRYRVMLLIVVSAILYLPAGIICDRCNVRVLIITSTLIQALQVAIEPNVVEILPFYWQFVITSATSIGYVIALPATTTLMASWFPLKHRTLSVTVVYSGYMLANTYCHLIVRALMIIHWKAPFYVCCSLNIIFAIIYVFQGYATPGADPHITQEELDILIGLVGIKHVMKPPLWAMLRSKSIMGLVIALMGTGFNELLVSTVLPHYFSEALQMDISNNIVETSVSGVVVVIQNLILALISDHLIMVRQYQIIYVRCWELFIAMSVSTCCVIITGYMRCEKRGAYAFYTAAEITRNVIYSSVYVNPLDISINNVGTVVGMMISGGYFSGELLAHLIFYVLSLGTFETWQLALWASFLINLTSTFLFCVLGKGTRQNWDYYNESDVELQKSVKRVRSDLI